jgi:hypothetical protein
MSEQGTVIVANSVTINANAYDMAQFNSTIQLLLSSLKNSNEIAGEVRSQLDREIRAGLEIAQSPKPSRAMLEFLLLRPLRYIAEKATGAAIGKIAGTAIEWLLRHCGLS